MATYKPTYRLSPSWPRWRLIDARRGRQRPRVVLGPPSPQDYLENHNNEAAAFTAIKAARAAARLSRFKARIRAVLAAPRAPVVKDPADAWIENSPWVIGRGPGATAKFSPDSKFVGWYGSGQRTGKPSLKHPIERELYAIEKRVVKALGRLQFENGKRSAQRQSLVSRSMNKARVLQLYADYIARGVPKRDMTAAIRAQLGIGDSNLSLRQIQRILKLARV